MGKLVPALMATGGTVTASVGGVLLVNKYGFSQGDGTAEGSADVDNGVQRTEVKDQQRGGADGKQNGVSGGVVGYSVGTSNDDPEVYGLSVFEKEKGGACVKHIFGGDLNFGETGSSMGPHEKINDDFSSNASEAVNSCLVVSWEKKNYSGTHSNQWKGYFRWVWSFSAGDLGFLCF